MPVTSRSQVMFAFVAYDESTFFLRHCRSCNATVEDKALFVIDISGSGAVAEPIRWRNETGNPAQPCGKRSRLCTQHSAPGGEGTGGSFWRSFPLSFLLKERGRRRPSSPPQCKIILPYSTRKLLFRKAPRRDFRKFTESSSTISNLWYNGFCISMNKFSGMDIGGLYHGKPCDDDDLRPGLHPCGR